MCNAEMPEIMCRFLWMIYTDSTPHVEFAGKTRGQFFMARGVRQSCPATGSFFATAFDPIFRWLLEAIIPQNPGAPDFLQPATCDYADDFAVAASSFRRLMDAFSCLKSGGPDCWTQPESSEMFLGTKSQWKLPILFRLGGDEL